MEFRNLGWSTDEVWSFIAPEITEPSYCEVIQTSIYEIKEEDIDKTSESAIYFHENSGPCNQPCTSISVDPQKVDKEIKFKIESTFTNNQVTHISSYITFNRAVCPDCLNPSPYP